MNGLNGFDGLTAGQLAAAPELKRALKQLNGAQQQAVETIDGPVLVIAGPGTGKTQLIGARVGYILAKAEVEPSNILLLTFTEAGVQAMRQRLERLVPAAAYKVHINTYHGFGNDLIRNHPEYFEGMEGDPLDELAATTIISSIIDKLPPSNALKAASYYPKEVLNFISDAKQALLRPDDITKIAKANLKFIESSTKAWRQNLDALGVISKASALIFEALLRDSERQPKAQSQKLKAGQPLWAYFQESLKKTLQEFAASGSTKPLTAWKNRWLQKDRAGRFVPAGKRANQRLVAAAGIYKQYQQKLKGQRAFDYDDMILRVIETLQAQPDFKYTLAEHYQYLMLDEFQDTNPAQMRLIELLSDHPVYEGRPNVLAVGDDDQAIYAFQGADHANMVHFAKLYRDVKLISLKENYRSHQDLIEAATNIARQISSRLHRSFPGIEKTLLAAGVSANQSPQLEAREFISDAAQYSWLAAEISRLIKKGTPATEIAVLAPKHKYLEALLPYLARQKLPIAYEKREDVLEDPKIRQLEQMVRLILALRSPNQKLADALWTEVISYDFWHLSTELIWQIVWRAKEKNQPLTNILLKTRQTKNIALLMLRLKDLSSIASLEELMDALIGIGQRHETLKLPIKSPFFEYYFGGTAIKKDPAGFTDLLSNLSLLRARLRTRQRRQASTTHLEDFIDFVDQSRSAELNVLNASPYHESKDAVNLLTAYGAKGREFKAVFVIAAQDEVWGSSSRVRSRYIKLPPNLEYISYAGLSDDERLRLLYVALTRAKSRLYLTSYRQTLDGRYAKHLGFLGINQNEKGELISLALPKKYSRIIVDQSAHIEAQTAEDYWINRHLPSYQPKLRDLLASKLDSYKLSATHLNKFTDVEGAGPQAFFIYYLLGFPQAPTPTTAFGTAIHYSLAWVGNQKSRTGQLPGLPAVLDYFNHQLEGGWLRGDERQQLRVRGQDALPLWLKQVAKSLLPSDRYEYSFANEGVALGKALLTGKIDRLVFDHKLRRITVVDIKTGKAFRKWESNVKLHKFQQQLMFYKLLVEGSSTFAGYTVDKGLIEFAEPDEAEIVNLEYQFKDQALEEFKKLVLSVWQRAQSLQLPATEQYPRSLKGIRSFESDLIK